MADKAAKLGTGRTGGRDATTGVIPGRFALSVGKPDTRPPEGWSWTALSTLAQLESGHTPSRKHPEYWNGGIPWIGIKDATENHGRTINDTYQHVSELGLENSSARLLPSQTVCLSRTASVGFVLVMGRPMATSQDFVNWVCGPGLDPHFLKFVLLAETEALWRFASGTTHQTIYYPEAKAFHICLPPIDEQRAIALVLRGLDDKIELNRRMNDTLEAMARALFKDWFVDFGPTYAKMEGRSPYLTSNLWDLFPNALSDEGVPEGWEEKRVEDILELAYGKSLPAKTRIAGSVPVYGSGGVGGYHNAPLIDGPSVIVGRKGTVGSLYWEDGPCYPIDTVFYVRPKVQLTFCFYLLQTLGLEGMNTDAAVPGLNRNNVYRLPVPWADEAVRRAFDSITSVLRERMRRNGEETRTLTEARDLLLPKLMSGEIRLRDAEKVVESVA